MLFGLNPYWLVEEQLIVAQSIFKHRFLYFVMTLRYKIPSLLSGGMCENQFQTAFSFISYSSHLKFSLLCNN